MISIYAPRQGLVHYIAVEFTHAFEPPKIRVGGIEGSCSE